MSTQSTPPVVLITGANSGIGQAAATELARRGWHVFAAARSLERGQAAVSQIQKDSGSIAVELLELDLASFASVRRAADELLERTERLDVLVNNAGLTLNERRVTGDGLETMMQTNHFSHVLLTSLLLPTLLESDDARVVNVSSRVYERVEAMPLGTTSTSSTIGAESGPTARPSWPTSCSPTSCISARTTVDWPPSPSIPASWRPVSCGTSLLPCARRSASRDHCFEVPSRGRRRSSILSPSRPDALTRASILTATLGRSSNHKRATVRRPNVSGSCPTRSQGQIGRPHDDFQPRRTDCRTPTRQRGVPGSRRATAR